jgi:hypothetical protein
VPHINSLVEHLHSYLDRVLDLLLEELRTIGHKTSIDQIIADIRLKHQVHLKILERAKNDKCTADNYKSMLFGNWFGYISCVR